MALVKPPHHSGNGSFHSPWDSYEDKGPFTYLFKVAPYGSQPAIKYAVPSRVPDRAAILQPREPLQALWIGHATVLFQAVGLNFITDPIFSRRASPVQFAGPARYTPPACSVEDLPPIHVCLITHNHYDHLDSGSIAALLELEKRQLAAAAAAAAGSSGGGAPSSGGDPRAATRPYGGTLFVCPLRMGPLLQSLGVHADRVVELDWWDAFVPAPLVSRGAASASGAVSSSTTAPGLDPTATAGITVKGPPAHHDYSAPAVAPAGAGAAPEPPVLAVGRDASNAALAPFSSMPRIVCVPAQHHSARTGMDRCKMLWCGFTVIAPLPTPTPTPTPATALTGTTTASPAHASATASDALHAGGASGGAGAVASAVAAVGGDVDVAVTIGAPPALTAHTAPAVAAAGALDVRFYHSGDTGYRNVPEGIAPLSAEEAAVPRCPAFARIGERYGPIDLAALPIGAYSPRWFMSSFHVSPEDAVCTHADLRAQRSLAMHWAAFPLTNEPIEEPPRRLAAARAHARLPHDAFVAVLPGAIVGASAGPFDVSAIVHGLTDAAVAGGADAELAAAAAAAAK